MNDLIEKLKDKKYVRAFGLMTPKEREYLREVGKENLLVLYGLPHENGSVYWKENEHNPDNYPALTYAINPDYQPEPEYGLGDICIRWLADGAKRQQLRIPSIFANPPSLSAEPAELRWNMVQG